MATTLIGYTDASGVNMGIWFSGEFTGFQCSLLAEGPQGLIFFYEVLAVYSTFRLSASYGCDQITIYCDNTDTVDMFGSLCAQLTYNSILICTVDFTLNTAIMTKVYFVPGTQNVIADHLSRFQNAEALHLAPCLDIQTFKPPQDAMGQKKNNLHFPNIQAAHVGALDN